MTLDKRDFLRLLAATAAGAGWAGARAQSDALTVKVGYAAGGGADIATRKMTPALAEALGQPVIVENQGGASGSVAANAFLRMPANGRTVLGLTGDDAILAPFGLATATYKPEQLRLVYPLRFVDVVLLSSLDKAPAGADELIALAKAAPRPFTFGNWGVGSTPHVASADLRAQGGFQGVDVPYRGQAPVIQDLIGRQIDFAFVPLNGPSIDMVRSGKVKAVLVAGAQRSGALPEVPAAGESRLLKDFVYRIWPAIFVQTATPEAQVERLHKHIAAVVHGPAYQQWSRETGSGPFTPMTASQAQGFYRSELERLARVVKAMKLTPQ